jgi:hypothetical protein
MAVFFSFLRDDGGEVPEQDASGYRVASFLGTIGGADLVPGPLLDTGEIGDIRELLMLCGLNDENMKPVQVKGGRAGRLGWIARDSVLSITPEIVFALSEVAARDFLIDLKAASDMVHSLRPSADAGCLIEVISPRNT